MRKLLYIIQKEFLQVFRNKSILPIIFVLPIVQMLLLVYAATFEMKEISLQIIDRDNSTLSRGLIADYAGSPFFNIVSVEHECSNPEAKILHGDADIVLIIPNNLEKEFVTTKSGSVQLLINAINGTAAELGFAYSNSVLQNYNKKLVFELTSTALNVPVQVKSRFWYNSELDYKFYMAPGILVILITIFGVFLGGVNLVREKELGTIEQINVTPIRKWQFLTGKLLPFWVIGLFDMLLGLLIAKIAFDIPIRGSIPVLIVFAGSYLMLVLSIGLFISSISSTQQQVALMGFFFLIVFILMSGLFTPIESMPAWAQKLNYINPLFYFVKIMRFIILKDSGFADLWRELAIVTGYGIVMMSLAVKTFKKTS